MENSIKNERSSIEEDIKILETWLEELNELFNKTHINNTKERNALYNILSDYKKLQEEFNEVDHECDRLEKIDFEKDMKIKELQKENEELKADRDKFKKALAKRITYCNELEKDLFENCSNYVIPKQVLKDKIEKIQEEGYWLFTTDRDSDKCVEVLQQLLGKEQ